MAGLSYGSRGDEVKKLQQELINAGYYVGSTGADGIFGNNTLAGLRQYQAGKGLNVSGIADEQTLASLYGTAQQPQQPQIPAAAQPQGMADTPTQTAQPAAQNVSPISSAAYQQALAALQNASDNAPSYANTYGGQLQDIYNQIANRGKFNYNINEDMLYQQYRDQYAQQGQMAMKDTLGQAAALTGGYGSSYGQAVGQQQYDAYLQRLNEVIPDLYSAAYDTYAQEGADLYKQYGLLGDMADDEYGKYADEYNRWFKERDYLQAQADDAWKRDYTMTADNRDHIMYLIKASGYNPTDEEIAAAGMTRPQADALRYRYYLENDLPMPADLAGYGGTGGAGGSGYGGGAPSTADIGDGKTYSNGLTSAQIEETAAAYFAANPTVELDSRTLDVWIANKSWPEDVRNAFKAYLQSMGAGWSSRAGGTSSAPKKTISAKGAAAGAAKSIFSSLK
jgi:peptidoglycan hydrolase-like protein with peptidoglycan-binding domain